MQASLPLNAGFRYRGPSMSENTTSRSGDAAPEAEDLAGAADRPDAATAESDAAEPAAQAPEANEPGDEIAVEVDASDIEPSGDSDVAEAAGDASAVESEASPDAEPVEVVEPDPVAELESKVAELDKKQKETYDRFLRATADLENFRKRSRRDVADARVAARASALREVLPVVDNLERALQHAETSAEPGGVIDGVKLVLRQFAQALERCEVKPVEAEGKAFDPNFHEAVSQIESDEHAPGTVVSVLQRGYLIGDRLLRPSMVVVAKAPPAPPADESEAADATDGEGKGNGAASAMTDGELAEVAGDPDDSASADEGKREDDGGSEEG